MDSATNYDELKDAITRAYPDMSKQLQRIARFALEKPAELALGTVAAVAEATEVQPSAMIRFANALGYGGFSEMQQVFRGHLVERSASYRERIDVLRRKQVNGQRAPAGVLHQLVGDSVGELGHLEENIRESDLKAAVRLLAGAERIHVLAQRRSFPVASYLAYALGQLELRTHLLDGAGGMLQESLRAIDKGDVLLVASFRSYAPEVIDAARGCARRGVPVVAITDGPLSPLLEHAKVCFELADDSSRAFRSLVAPLCLAQALVMSTGHHLAEKPEPKTSRKGKA
ncbi:MAG: MurR/RpiR family transcriptional regulator [Burkholderiales bacterium]|nr:MurR/RpiR family transcriptional regulator [Burkholderiales bacterium]